MADEPYVTVEDVKARWLGSASLPDDAVIKAWIADAEAELREHIPNLDALVESGRIARESVVKIVCKAVIGALRNADGFRSESEGDYSYSRFGDGFVWYRQSDIDRLIPRSTMPGVIRSALPCGWQ